nr:DUF4468 domain-containing protein [uncultured Emticicia sp.]
MDEINYKPLKYEDVINVPNIEKKKIYLRSRIWFYKTFVNDKAVLSFSDFENGILIGNGTFRASIGGYVKFSIRIYIKDNNYKYVIDGLVHYDDVVIYQGTTSDESMGLLTTSKVAPFSNTRMALDNNNILKSLKFLVDEQIKILTDSLKNTILNDTEADF